jgi:integrase
MSTGVVKRGKSYTFRVDLGIDPETGKRRQYRGTYPTAREAKQARAALVAEHGKGYTPARRDVTFASYSNEWLDSRARRVREVTMRGYRVQVNHGVRAFGNKRIGDITRGDVERLVTTMDSAGHSLRSVSLLLFVLRSIFGQALDDGQLIRNPAAKVEPSGAPAKTREALSANDLAKLRAHAAGDRLYGCWLLTLYGLRRSELLALRWTDVDLTSGTLMISKGVTPDRSSRRAAETAPKTRRGRRTLQLPTDVIGALRQLRDRQAAEFGFDHARTGYLVVDEAGEPYRPERWSYCWQRLCRDAGVPPVTLYAARHSSVTAMRNAGVPDHQVAEWHGHDEPTMRRVYSHADPDGLAAAGEALSKVLSGGSL